MARARARTPTRKFLQTHHIHRSYVNSNNHHRDREAEDAARRQAGIDWLATQPIPNFDD